LEARKPETAEIKDAYAYDGNGLRASQTISATTTYMVWDMTEELPLILSDTTNSYIYGPDGLPIEQISSGGTVTYLHHDQQGSTRLLTGSTGSVTGKCTYSAYGTPTCEGATTTPLGYDGQYTSTDTGLIYLQARVYDPATAQFLTVDPAVATTQAPYFYTEDNPLNEVDRTGLEAVGGNCTTTTTESGSNIPPFGGPFPYNPGQKGGAPNKLKGGQGFKDKYGTSEDEGGGGGPSVGEIIGGTVIVGGAILLQRHRRR
jgi:RHS repeat-associated protein